MSVHAVRLATVLPILVGGLYVVAWRTGLAARWSAAGIAVVKANMAASLLAAGTALLLLHPSSKSPVARAVGIVLSEAVLLVGLLTLIEHLFRTDIGIDQLLATEPPGAIATTSPNRLGPPGALSLTFLGGGLLALAARRRFAPYFGLATAVIVLVPATGFLFGIAQFHADAAVTGIAWPTVVCLLSLAIGLLVAQGREGPFALLWRNDAGGTLLRQLLPPALLLPIVLQVVRLAGERLGLHGRSTGIGLYLISLVLLFSILLWRSASHLSAAAARAQEAQQQARWRADLLDLAHDAIIVWSPATGIESWNRGATELYGYGAGEALGRNPQDLLHTSFPRPVPELLEELHRVDHWEGELRQRTKDGREVVVSSKLRTVRGMDGLDRVLETNRDMTRRKQMEDELRESSRRKDEFLGVLSHELRNPLAPISNSLYVLDRSEPDGEQARRSRAVIGRQLTHLTRLVDDLLEATRMSRGTVRLRRSRLDICELVRRTGEDHRGLFERQGIGYAIAIAGQPAWVDGDETRLAQIMGNLLQNAAKFTPAGGHVTLAVETLNGSVEVHVRDTGAGIDPAFLRRVFEPFVQAEQTLARTEGGLGLGLALVRDLTALHGGSVHAFSDGPGKGAELVVRLPKAAAPLDSKPRAVCGDVGRRLRVLVVEDNVDAADSLADLVRTFGHDVEVAHDGPTAIARARAAPPDLVLCDIGLPGMSGYELARVLRSDPRGSALRLVAISGYAQPEDVQRSTDAGFVAHIRKPPDPSKLRRLLT
jgi:PAS domain S-box-containing protein